MKYNFSQGILNARLLKTVGLMAAGYILTDQAHAIPTGVAAVESIGNAIMPYVKWTTSIGGAAIAVINGWRVFNGQPKAGFFALGGGVVAGLGFDSIFGADVSAMVIP